MTQNQYAIWIPSQHGRYLLFFETLDDAYLYIVKFGGGLEVILNTFEYF